MANKPVRYCVVDAFTDSAFKGNPAAVCLLEDDKDDEWLQAVATEFNISQTAFLTRLTDSADSVPTFLLRWFTPVAEVKLCGHATLAAFHFLFSYDLVKTNTIEFSTLSGILTATKVVSDSSIELDFPIVPIKEYDSASSDEIKSTLCKSLNISSVNEIHNTTTAHDRLVVLPSGEAVVEVEPNFEEIRKCPGRGLIVTGLAPTGSGFDFFTRFFCPKLGIYEVIFYLFF